MRYGKTTKMIQLLKQSDNTCMIVKNKKEKAEIIKQFKLSFKNGSKIRFPKEQKDEGFKSWSSFDALPLYCVLFTMYC